jgi:hypothetical protein
VNDELERSGSGLFARYYSGTRLEGQKKTTNPSVRIASFQATILTKDLPDIKQEYLVILSLR